MPGKSAGDGRFLRTLHRYGGVVFVNIRIALGRGLIVAVACAVLSQAASAAPSAAGARNAPRARPAQSGVDVLTYHNDTQRTGWNAAETILTTSNVNAATFGLLQTVPLDARVDAQPLVVTSQPIDGQGIHDVVYVATENNSLYALDATSGAVLWQVNFGPNVPDSFKSGDDNVYPFMGILSTPVVDRALNAIFVVSDVFQSSSDFFALHQIALNNGSDQVAPVVIQASQKTKNGSLWTFNSQFQLQRPGLLEANGSIYVAFGSNGDINPNISRGTILRYDASTLTPQDEGVTDTLAIRNDAYYLTSIWQSGYGLATDAAGNIYFSTGNSDPNKPTYNAAYNHPEGTLKLSGDLSTLLSNFTPANYFSLDQGDADVGSGGTMVIPPQSGGVPNMILSGGKDGRAFLMDANDLGGHSKNKDKVLAELSSGSCWCGPAYFVGSDGVSRLVTGGGNGVTSWKLVPTAHKPQVSEDSSTGSSVVNGLPDGGGVIPSISSNGTAPGTAIAWFVQRPQSNDDNEPGTPVTLYAFDASNLSTQLFSAQAGLWRHAVNSNANIVPTVANGFVYVASNEQLQIFGLLSQQRGARAR